MKRGRLEISRRRRRRREKACKTCLVSVHVQKLLLKQLDRIVERGYYISRSDAIRAAIRDLVIKILILEEKDKNISLMLGIR